MSEVKIDLNIDLNNLDKSNWKIYRFDEIAKNISERVDPNNTDLKVYIGLEHIDSESLHIKRQGTPDDVNGTKLKFYKGDIIFGRRRAYQRKAGIATSDGFCSAHALVLRANPDVIDPELFPFFLHSDLFMNRAIDISVGSLSPTINWGTLKHQDFLVPPKEQQAEMSKLFWSMNKSIQAEYNQLNKLEVFKKSKAKELLTKGVGHTKFKKTVLGDIPECWEVTTFESLIYKMKSGLSRRIVSEDIGIPVLISGNIQDEKLDVTELKYWYEDDPQGANVSDYILDEGDLLLCFINSLSQIGKCCIYKDIGRDAIYTTNLFRIIAAEGVDRDFLYYLICSNYIQKKIEQITKPAVNQASFTKADFLKIKVPCPPYEEQKFIANYLNQISDVRKSTLLKITDANTLNNSIINQVL